MVPAVSCYQVCLARELGLCYASIALATDYDCWRQSDEPVSVEMVLKTFKANVGKAISILTTVVEKLQQSDWQSAVKASTVSTHSHVRSAQLPGLQLPHSVLFSGYG